MGNRMVVRQCHVVVRPGGKKSLNERGVITAGGWCCVHVDGSKSYWVKASEEKSECK